MRGWVFLPLTARPPIMLRGEPPSAQFVPFYAYWGGIPLDRAACRRWTGWLVARGRGGDTPAPLRP